MDESADDRKVVNLLRRKWEAFQCFPLASSSKSRLKAREAGKHFPFFRKERGRDRKQKYSYDSERPHFASLLPFFR
jgi:hypothetical protein